MLADLARRQHGVIGRRQLRELGLDDAGIARRIAAGRLHRLHRGVYAVGHTRLSREGRWLAAVLRCGAGAVLSHASAAALWRLRPSSSSRIDVTVPRSSGGRSTPAIVVHRPRHAVDATTRDAIPVTTPMRTLADLADVLPRRALEKAAETAEALRLLDVRALPAGHRGAARVRAVLTAHDLEHTTRSVLEDAFLELCDRHGLPRPLVNHRVAGLEVDFCWPNERVIVEVDGYERHGTRAGFERDRARDARLTAAGWRTIRFSYVQVFERPETVVAAVVSARSPSPATLGSPSP